MASAAGVDVKVEVVRLAWLPLRLVPNVIPAGVLVTVPLPVPAVLTVRVVLWSKVAVTAVSLVRVTVQAPVPEHPPPLQPVKINWPFGEAKRVTAVPLE